MFAPEDVVVVIVDGPDPDNYALALAATGEDFNLNVVAVIMTGRPVSANHQAPHYAFNRSASQAVRRDNALHMKGLLMRHGRESIEVFQGLRAPFSTIPHKFHIHERVTDIHYDAHAGHELAGDIDDAIVYLSDFCGKIHFVCGGPMTDLAYLMKQPLIMDKLGIVTAQLGMFGFGEVETISGGRRQFNALADPSAARTVLLDYPGPLYMVPTDITKHRRHAFNSPDDLSRLAESSGFKELVEMYYAAWPIMWGPRNEKIYVHDFHSAELMCLLSLFTPPHHQSYAAGGRDEIGRYSVSPVTITHVPYQYNEMERWGEIDIEAAFERQEPARFLADGIDTSQHIGALRAALNCGPRQFSATPRQADRAV